MNAIIITIASCVMGALLSFIIWYLRDIKAGFATDQEKQDKRIDKIEGKLDAMPETYLFRDDFLRWSITIDKKIDDLKQDIKYLIDKGAK